MTTTTTINEPITVASKDRTSCAYKAARKVHLADMELLKNLKLHHSHAVAEASRARLAEAAELKLKHLIKRQARIAGSASLRHFVGAALAEAVIML
jgi:hypothetical protein